MFKAILSIVLLAIAISVLAWVAGYFDYRSNVNNCLAAGGIVIKTSQGLKCVPRGEIKFI